MSRHPAPVHSALYEGRVSHVRWGTPGHRFAQGVALCYLDLDELPTVLDRHPLWSTCRGHPVQFRRADYAGDRAVPLADAVRDLAAPAAGGRPEGPVRLLAHLRTWGWCFNPLALAYCFDADGTTLRAVVATVTNTPWGERHDYPLPALADGTVDARVAKALHVSPFFGMNQTYRFRLGPPGEELAARVDDEEDDRVVLRADLRLRRRPLDRRAMTALMVRHPVTTWRVSAGIYWQAARLAAKGAPRYPHPGRAARPGSAPAPGRGPRPTRPADEAPEHRGRERAGTGGEEHPR